MNQFKISAQPIITTHLIAILDKYEKINTDKYNNFSSSATISTVTTTTKINNTNNKNHNISSSASSGTTAGIGSSNNNNSIDFNANILIASVQSEILNLEKNYLSFIHQTTLNCIESIVCEVNLSYIELIFYHIQVSLRGNIYNSQLFQQRNNINIQNTASIEISDLEESLPQRKVAVQILSAFVSFLTDFPTDMTTTADNNNNNNNNNVLSTSSLTHHDRVQIYNIYFKTHILDNILPIILQSCISHKLCYNFTIQNNSTHSYYSEVAILLCLLYKSYGEKEMLMDMIIQQSNTYDIGWSPDTVKQLEVFFINSSNQNHVKVKDSFKRLLQAVNNNSMNF
jgi:hypothetical protein